MENYKNKAHPLAIVCLSPACKTSIFVSLVGGCLNHDSQDALMTRSCEMKEPSKEKKKQ